MRYLLLALPLAFLGCGTAPPADDAAQSPPAATATDSAVLSRVKAASRASTVDMQEADRLYHEATEKEWVAASPRIRQITCMIALEPYTSDDELLVYAGCYDHHILMEVIGDAPGESPAKDAIESGDKEKSITNGVQLRILSTESGNDPWVESVLSDAKYFLAGP